MAAAAFNSSTFHLFSSLAFELRNQIWRDALPETVGPALYFYKKGCWCHRLLLPSDEKYDHDHDHSPNICSEFRHDLLDAVQVKIPLFFVSHEARNVALAWVREHNIQIHDDRQFPIFTCPFVPLRDVLYIALERWDEFLCEPDDRHMSPDSIGQYFYFKSADVTGIAVPEALFQNKVAADLARILVITILFYFFIFES